MGTFSLKDSDEYYLELTEKPKRFEADSPVTNVFFDDTNGQVFTVRSGGVTGVSVSGMDDSKSTSFRMEDKGPITSIKFSLNHKILAIQRNRENQASSVEFQNFQELAPTNVEYTHMCKWKNAKILGFVWPKDNEIAFVTDHGIELLQVVAEKKLLKSLKNTSFSGAWFTWCAQSKILLLASNNGTLLQPFSLASSTITKLHKLELESGKPVAERDVVAIRVYGATWCAVFRHANAAQSSAGPTEVCLMPVWGSAVTTHVLKTGLVGRFAVSVIDDIVIVHHQSSQTSLLFDIEEECKTENNLATHIPLLPGLTIKPAFVDEQLCPMYSGNWVVFQPDYLVDARLGCLWQLKLSLTGFLHCVPKDEISKLISALLRRSGSKELVVSALRQLLEECGTFLAQLPDVFDAVLQAQREWSDCETQRQTCGTAPAPVYRVVLTQNDICQHVLAPCSEHPYIVQALTCYMASLCRCDMAATAPVAELAASLMRPQRVANIVRRGCLTDGKPIACQLLSLGHLEPAAAQLALDMMYRLKAHEEIVEVLLSYEEPIAAAAAARHGGVWNSLPARKLLAAASTKPQAFVSLYHALRARDSAEPPAHRIALNPNDNFAAHYKKLTSD